MARDLPPEIITRILSFLPVEDAATIRDLLTLTLTNRTLSSLALQQSLWFPIATATWSIHSSARINKERVGSSFDYVRYRSHLDRSARILLTELAVSTSGNLARLESLRIMGNNVIDRIEEDRKDAAGEEYLSTRYWSREALDRIARDDSVKTWKRLARQPSDEVDDLEKGVMAFESFIGMREMQYQQGEVILNALAAEMAGNMSPGTPTQVVLQIFQEFARLGIRIATGERFHDIKNSFLSTMIAPTSPDFTPSGTLPLTLVVLFCSLIRRLRPQFNIQARAINFPGVVLAAIAPRTDALGQEDWIYVELGEMKFLQKGQCQAMATTMGVNLTPEDLKPARAADMCLRVARNLLRSIRTAQQGHRGLSEAGLTPSLYAAATALFLLSPPDPRSPYVVWLGPICQAEFPSDVSFLEESVLPFVADKTALELLCKSIREEDETLKEFGNRKYRKAGIDWKVGHCFRHKLFGYVAVVRGWDETCLASEDWIQAMQVDTLPNGRNQPFYHVIVEDGSSRYVANENITSDSSITLSTFNSFEQIHLMGRYFRKRGTDPFTGRTNFIQSRELEAVYPVEAGEESMRRIMGIPPTSMFSWISQVRGN